MTETRYYKGIYKVTIIEEKDYSAIVRAEEDMPLTSTFRIPKGEQFLTITRLLHKQKKET